MLGSANLPLNPEDLTALRLLSVDIEISDVFELAEHEDMEKYAPFHISVAATAIYSGVETVWYSQKEAASSEPALNMTSEKAKEFSPDHLARSRERPFEAEAEPRQGALPLMPSEAASNPHCQLPWDRHRSCKAGEPHR